MIRKLLHFHGICREILFALSSLPGDTATRAIADAVFDKGEGDDIKDAISRWSAARLRSRLDGKAAAQGPGQREDPAQLRDRFG